MLTVYAGLEPEIRVLISINIYLCNHFFLIALVTCFAYFTVCNQRELSNGYSLFHVGPM